MKNLNYRPVGRVIAIFMTVFIIGCVSDPVKVDLPANHPANPQSNETAFTSPPNPFEQHMPMTGHEADEDSSMIKKEHPSAHQHQMPGMGHDFKPGQESEAAEPEHQHKEHN